eukprot:c9323_g1_i2.p2 GENE.c9323_g1_i2~~c9323_g1_i2.p2  ORF type:complete len:102 (-),score=27.13 c9323_g1_i2:791-1096(-)
MMDLFMDDGIIDDKGMKMETANLPKQLSEDWHSKWNPNNRLTIHLIELLRSHHLNTATKRIGLQILRNLALHEVRISNNVLLSLCQALLPQSQPGSAGLQR